MMLFLSHFSLYPSNYTVHFFGVYWLIANERLTHGESPRSGGNIAIRKFRKSGVEPDRSLVTKVVHRRRFQILILDLALKSTLADTACSALETEAPSLTVPPRILYRRLGPLARVRCVTGDAGIGACDRGAKGTRPAREKQRLDAQGVAQLSTDRRPELARDAIMRSYKLVSRFEDR